MNITVNTNENHLGKAFGLTEARCEELSVQAAKACGDFLAQKGSKGILDFFASAFPKIETKNDAEVFIVTTWLHEAWHMMVEVHEGFDSLEEALMKDQRGAKH